jgi:hypothetical protein
MRTLRASKLFLQALLLYPAPVINVVFQQQDMLARASGPLGSQCGVASNNCSGNVARWFLKYNKQK